jgi:hypothetical protein
MYLPLYHLVRLLNTKNQTLNTLKNTIVFPFFFFCKTANLYLYQNFRNFHNFISRSGFKTSDQVQGQGVRPIEKAQHTWVCEHLSEACNAAIGPQMGF